MFNPLLPDLSKLKNEDIDNRITELMKKFLVASRSGQGGVCNQISIILEAYREEQSKRHQAALEKLESKGKNFDDFINVDH
jgi:hypothetical protein